MITPLCRASLAALVVLVLHLEDFGAVVHQVARCLRPRGRFICVGLHPCFIGPFVDRTNG